MDHTRMHTCIMSWLCANKTSFTDTEIWISYDFLVSGDSRLLFIFSNHLKNNQNHSQLTGHTKAGVGRGLPPLA